MPKGKIIISHGALRDLLMLPDSYSVVAVEQHHDGVANIVVESNDIPVVNNDEIPVVTPYYCIAHSRPELQRIEFSPSG